MIKQIWLLVTLVCIALGIGWWTLQEPKNSVELDTQNRLFPDLRANAEQIDQVTIRSSQGQVLLASRTDSGWQASIPDAQGTYPLDSQPLAALLNALADATLDEKKTSNPAKYAVLGIQDLAVEDSLARQVTIQSAEHTWQVLIGNAPSVRQGSYVRRPDQAQVWFTQQETSLPLDEYAWLRQPILPFELADVQTLSKLGEEPWQIQLLDNQFVLSPMLDQAELVYADILEGYVETFLGLPFDSLAPKLQSNLPLGSPSNTNDQTPAANLADSDLASNASGTNNPGSNNLGSKNKVVFTLKTRSEQTITVSLVEQQDEYFVTFESAFSQDYWTQWRYQISSFHAGQLDKSIGDFTRGNDSPSDSTTGLSEFNAGQNDLDEHSLDEKGPDNTSIDEGQSPQ